LSQHNIFFKNIVLWQKNKVSAVWHHTYATVLQHLDEPLPFVFTVHPPYTRVTGQFITAMTAVYHCLVH